MTSVLIKRENPDTETDMHGVQTNIEKAAV